VQPLLSAHLWHALVQEPRKEKPRRSGAQSFPIPRTGGCGEVGAAEQREPTLSSRLERDQARLDIRQRKSAADTFLGVDSR
jgi:hypothetical protein